MTDLTEKWKKGELDGLEELIKQIKVVDDSRSLSDEYLKENDCMTREECDVAEEHLYGIVTVISDYVLPYLEQLQIVKDENKRLNLKISGLQAQNAELIETNDVLSCQNKQLKGLLRECIAHLSLGEMGTSVMPLNILLTIINAAIGESEE